MSEHEVTICDQCSKQLWDEYAYGEGWRKNVDGDDFCPDCAKTLDPPEDDNDN